MCLICESKGDYTKLQDITTLKCDDCPIVTEIPIRWPGGSLDGLQELHCSNCKSLEKIPIIHGLKSLFCFGCPLLTEIPMIEGLQTLDCSGCPLLTKISVIHGLQIIFCSNCPLLEEIPQIDGLTNLICSRCVLLTKIPMIFGLKYLSCSNCPMITEIPVMMINELQTIYCRGCPWIRRTKEFSSNISKLIKLQKFCRKNLKILPIQKMDKISLLRRMVLRP